MVPGMGVMTIQDYFTPQAVAVPEIDARIASAEPRPVPQGEMFHRFTTADWCLGDGRTRRAAALIEFCEGHEPKGILQKLKLRFGLGS